MGTIAAQDLFKEALSIIGALDRDETAQISDLNTCMLSCNFMLDAWAGKSLLSLASVQENFPLVGGVVSYQIGTGATFNTTRPVRIQSAFIRNTASSYDFPVEVVERDVYDVQEDKLLSSGYPELIFYDPGATQQATATGTIYCYPVPSGNYQLFINSVKMFSEFASLTDIVTFPPSYYEAIVQNLAVRIWPKFHGVDSSVPVNIMLMARESLQTIKNMNSRIPAVFFDLPGSGGGNFNIYSGV